MRKPTLHFISLLTAVMMLPALVWAAQMTGKVQSISRKASTIQMMNLKTKEVDVIRFSKNTKFVNAKSIKEFIVNDKIVVDASPGEPAQQIKRVLVKIDPKKIIGTKEVAALMRRSPEEYLIVDARPGGVYDVGHIPGSISMPTADFKKKTSCCQKTKTACWFSIAEGLLEDSVLNPPVWRRKPDTPMQKLTSMDFPHGKRKNFQLLFSTPGSRKTSMNTM